MRIPSQFNEDTLYTRHPRRNDSTHAGRRLLRLTLGLVLVLMVMRQAAKPGVYQPFFPDSPAPANVDLASPPAVNVPPIDDDDRRVANAVVDSLPEAQQRSWMVAMSRAADRSTSLSTEAQSAMIDALNTIDTLDPSQRRQWQSLFDSIGSADDSPGERSTDWQSKSAALTAALDNAAANRVVDGSVWRGGDFDLFYRYLDTAPQMSPRGAATVGVIPLLQQPDVFRGQLVRISGTVARGEQITAPDNAFGIGEYWQLWLRPADGADRPLVAIVPSIPPSLQSQLLPQTGDPATLTDGPAVTLVGRYLKRLAYQSSIGADLAPVVVGRLLIATAPQSETAATATDEPSPTSQPTSLWGLMLIAVVIGVTLAALAYWQTTALAKRSRALRRAAAGNPQSFLDSLGSADQLGEPDSSPERPADPNPRRQDPSQ